MLLGSIMAVNLFLSISMFSIMNSLSLCIYNNISIYIIYAVVVHLSCVDRSALNCQNVESCVRDGLQTEGVDEKEFKYDSDYF